ncbi:MAG: hypothetical protein ACE149_13650 [Armatimonadota bacterium]
MSYFRHGSEQAEHLVDRLPVYVFPAFIGSGRMLLGVGLAGVTTAVILRTHAAADPVFWGLGVLAYLAGLVLVVSGIYAVNVVPERRPLHLELEPEPLPHGPPPPRQPLAGEQPLGMPAPAGEPPPQHWHSRLADLLVDRWHLVTPEQLRQALTHKSNSGRSLVHELARMGLLTDAELERVLGMQAAAQDPWHDSDIRG